MTLTDAWRVVCLELAGDNPVAARQIYDSCTFDEIGEAWQNNRRKIESVGFRVKKHG